MPRERSVKSKKERVEELKRRITTMVAEVEMDGLVFFAGLAPDDRDPGDLTIPSFKAHAGEFGHVAALVGDTFASAVLEYEQAVQARSADVRLMLADTVITSMRHAFGKADAISEAAQEALWVGAGPHYVKKAGNA